MLSRLIFFVELNSFYIQTQAVRPSVDILQDDLEREVALSFLQSCTHTFFPGAIILQLLGPLTAQDFEMLKQR